MSDIQLCENCRKAQESKSGHAGQCYCHMLVKSPPLSERAQAKLPPGKLEEMAARIGHGNSFTPYHADCGYCQGALRALSQRLSGGEGEEREYVESLAGQCAMLRDELSAAKSALNKFELIYTAGAEGERALSCCEGKHFDETLMAGDAIYRVSYVDAKSVEALLPPGTTGEK